MKYLNQSAASLFLDSSRIAHYFGFLPWSLLIARLVALHSMCAPDDLTRTFVEHILRLEEEYDSAEWTEGEEVARVMSQSESGLTESTIEEREDDDGAVSLQFLPSGTTGLSRWVFHQYDDDYFPSIPHGHFEGRNQQKLDAYLGWIYHGSKQNSREPRKKIIALWNDAKFRELARMAIDYFHTHHPQYNGWRVLYPRRLPRRR